MNLHGIVSGNITAVNPMINITVRISTGAAAPAADGTLVPTYATPFTAIAQVQELTTRDLRQLEALNIQGSSRVIYLNGEVDAIVRLSQKGGDLITFPDGTIWLTTSVMELWPDWVKISVTEQLR